MRKLVISVAALVLAAAPLRPATPPVVNASLPSATSPAKSGSQAAPAASRSVSNAPKPPARPAAKAVPALSDAQIEAAIRAKFANSKIHEDKFRVNVQGGVATLEGETNVIQHKGVATRLAKSGGAVSVNNRIQISDAARKKAAERMDLARRRAEVTRSGK